MLKEIDLKLFEVLDSEIDKSLNSGNIWCICEYSSFDEDVWEDVVYDVDYFENEDLDKKNYRSKIIWRYPTTNTVLRYLHKKELSKITLWGGIIYIDTNIEKFRWHSLDITKEIIDYTNEKKQELYDLLLKLK